MISPKTTAMLAAAVLAPQLAHAQSNSLQTSSVASTNTSINASSAQSADASQASSTGTLIVLGAGLLAGVGGGITTTMYRRDERAKRVVPPAPPPPAPLEVVPYPGPTEPTPPPPPPPLSKVTPDGEPTIDAMVEARWWLLANEVQLKQDLALGAGPALDDLAGLARIAPSRRAHFFKLLQKNRAVLLTPRDVTPREAALMMSRVGELVLADPILRADGQAALAAL